MASLALRPWSTTLTTIWRMAARSRMEPALPTTSRGRPRSSTNDGAIMLVRRSPGRAALPGGLRSDSPSMLFSWMPVPGTKKPEPQPVEAESDAALPSPSTTLMCVVEGIPLVSWTGTRAFSRAARAASATRSFARMRRVAPPRWRSATKLPPRIRAVSRIASVSTEIASALPRAGIGPSRSRIGARTRSGGRPRTAAGSRRTPCRGRPLGRGVAGSPGTRPGPTPSRGRRARARRRRHGARARRGRRCRRPPRPATRACRQARPSRRPALPPAGSRRRRPDGLPPRDGGSSRGCREGTPERRSAGPCRAISTAGPMSSAQGSRPKRWCAAARPAGAPGTATVAGPMRKTCFVRSSKGTSTATISGPRPAPGPRRARRRRSPAAGRSRHARCGRA